MITYKGTHSDLKCRGFQYEIGKTFKHSDEITLCRSGFHSCRFPVDCLLYYRDPTDRYFKVEASGNIGENTINEDSKIVSSKIRFIKEVTIADLIKTSIHNFGEYKKDKYVNISSFYVPKKNFETTSHVGIKCLLNDKHSIYVIASFINRIYNIGRNCRFKADFQIIYSIGDNNYFQQTLKICSPYVYIKGNRNVLSTPTRYAKRKDFNSELFTKAYVVGNMNVINIVYQRGYIDGDNNIINILDSAYVDFSDKSECNSIVIKEYTPTLIVDSKHPVEIRTERRKIVTQGYQVFYNLIPELI